ncbi:Gfo/Idh/MocA family protein [Rhizobium sullae]|uniref:Putative dehydrogenase n=1 Tax=Rhizobium sullae TaxID=50338 RepID=A0A4R3Q139_RHISU|nr:Gfo/Idh/MocA family oxidoreductase [Rhizobium sullae]TCU09672.1 putative dehydrogenase [Rhizobium sullae]
MNRSISRPTPTLNTRRPRLGFLGLGWIGRHRMEAILKTGLADAAAIADPSSGAIEDALKSAPSAKVAASLDGLLDLDLDGIVIATPSALHAEQSIEALERGVAVFCQKPLGRSTEEVTAVIEAARRADRLLGVDLSYRHTAAMQEIRNLVRSGTLGEIFAADLTFHNAYGPDKPWFYDKSLSGGGCVMDLGVHLADLALWAFDFPEVEHVSARLYSKGKPIGNNSCEVEDFAVATIDVATGAVLRLTCSWRLQAGRDAVIGACFYGTKGGAEFRNIDGSFYDFVAEQYEGTHKALLTAPPDDWGGRAAADWAWRLAESRRFDPQSEHLIAVARLLDAIYKR